MQKKDENRIHECLNRAIDELQPNFVSTLIRLGFKGKRECSTNCPLVNYFTAKIEELGYKVLELEVLHRLAIVIIAEGNDRRVTVYDFHGLQVECFINQFDGGSYPQLES